MNPYSDISCSSDVLFDELINEVLSRDESTSTTDVMEEFLLHPLHHSHPSLTNDTEGTLTCILYLWEL